MPHDGLIRDLEEIAHGLRTLPVLDWDVNVKYGPDEPDPDGGRCTEVVEYQIMVTVRRPVRNCHGHDTPDPGGA